MRKYDQAKVVDDEVDDEKQRDELAKAVYNDRFTQWKKEYYQVSALSYEGRATLDCFLGSF
jgi:hypothetical protein